MVGEMLCGSESKRSERMSATAYLCIEIYEINRRFLGAARGRFPMDKDRIQRVNRIEDGSKKQVRMANLAVVVLGGIGLTLPTRSPESVRCNAGRTVLLH